MIVAIRIPKFLWQNKDGEIKDDADLPDGNYKITVKVDRLANLAEPFLQLAKGTFLQTGKDSVFLTDYNIIDDTTIVLEVSVVGAPVLLIAGVIGGILLLVVGSVTIFRIQKLVEVSYPLIIGAAIFAIATPAGRKLLK